MSGKNETSGGGKAVRRFIEYTIIGASCLYLGFHVYKNVPTK